MVASQAEGEKGAPGSLKEEVVASSGEMEATQGQLTGVVEGHREVPAR
jgi:hypothetical protein